jgi:hypothetical protein
MPLVPTMLVAGNNGEIGRRVTLVRARRAAAAMVGLMLLTSGCRVGDLSFRIDDRVEIVSPEQRATVTLPFDVRWTVEDFNPVGFDGSATDDAGAFAVLLDVTPQPPGEPLAYFARDDDTCRPSQGCPDATYLADHRIHTTQTTSFRVDALPDNRPTDRPSAPDDHEITVVLLNGKGERIGESAFRVTVIVDREQA